MARIRTVKPSFWSDGKVASLSRDARLTLIGLISFADDEGRFLASPTAVGGYVFPHDRDVTTKHVHRWMDEITATGIVQVYEIDGCVYGRLPKWSSHQKINKQQRSIIPAPETGSET